MRKRGLLCIAGFFSAGKLEKYEHYGNVLVSLRNHLLRLRKTLKMTRPEMDL